MANAKSLLTPEAIVYVVLDYAGDKEGGSAGNTMPAEIDMNARTHQFIIFRGPGLPSSFKRSPLLLKRQNLDPFVCHEL